METSAAAKCLERLGITLAQLQQEPGYFLTRVHPGDRAKFTRRLRDCALETELNVTLYDENSRARKDRVNLGTFLEYVDEETSSLRVGLVVSCLKSRVAAVGTQSQDMLLVVELPGESSETAKMPPPDAMSRIIPTSAITCKIDVEQRGPSAPVQQQAAAAPFQPQPVAQQQPMPQEPAFLPPLQPRAAPSAILQSLADRNGAFVCALGSSFYGLEPEGTIAIGSYVSSMLSVACSGSEMFATTDSGRLLSVELDQGRVRELGPTLLGQQQIRVYALCFAEGKPPRAPMYAIAKDVPTLNGDCLIIVHATGKCELVFELGRRDITALACVPIPHDFTRERNAWYSIGPSDANPSAMRFVLWTERGGLFVIDDTRRSLQQLGGELVQSLEISAICFDSAGDLFAAGSKSLYMVGPAGRVVEVTPLQQLPGRVAGICYVPRTLLHPQPAVHEEEEPAREEEYEKEEEEPRAKDPRKKSWWKLTTGGGETLLRLLRPSKSKTPASAAAPAVEAPKPNTEAKRTSVNKQQAASPPRTVNANMNRTSAPPAPVYYDNAPSFLNESFTGQPLQQQQQRIASQRQHTGPYYPAEPTMAPPPAPMHVPNFAQQHLSQPASMYAQPTFTQQQHLSQPAPMYVPPTFTQQPPTHNHSHISNSFVSPPASQPPPTTARAPSLPPPPTTARAQQPRPISSSAPLRPKDVPTLLHTLGLTQYAADFRREELLDINLLISMYTNDRDFKEILKDVGVTKLGHREIVAHAIRQYQQH